MTFTKSMLKGTKKPVQINALAWGVITLLYNCLILLTSLIATFAFVIDSPH